MPKPGHTPSLAALLARADEICAGRGARLTDLRREVLGLILASPKPSGAYDLLDRLRAHHKGAAPPTVYRALDFLVEHGLVHKVERLSAFVGCVHEHHQAHGHGHDHAMAAQFLICRGCGAATELNDAGIGRALLAAAAANGFAVANSTVEAMGVCAACAARTARAAD